MKDFDLRKYLAENRLLKEDAISKLKSKVKDMSKEEFTKLAKRVGDLSKFKMASKGKKDDGTPIDPFSNVDDRLEVIDQNFDEKDAEKYLAEGKLLKEELRDVEDILVKAGFRFDDGLLGGVGSGGAGYYDKVNDDIYGYNQSGPWNEEKFNKFYDNFEFSSNYYGDTAEFEDLGIDANIIFNELDDGIYAVGDEGYVEIRSDGDIEIYATPQLSDEEGREILPAFKMDAMGRAIPQYSKDEMRKILKDDMYYII